MKRSARSEGKRSGDRAGRWFRRAATVALAILVGTSPLLAGSVHRPAVIAVLLAVSLTLASALAGNRLRGGSLRGQPFSLFFFSMVILSLAQLIPLPSVWRAALDGGGASLLENAPAGLPRFWPLSLDPTSTRAELGTASAALAVFLLALHIASGRRHRMLVVGAVAIAGVVASIFGVGHRIFGVDRLYGQFASYGSILLGPFINPNHSAEFYELAAFAALALAAESEAETRIAWYVAAGLNAAVAVTTLSRGALLALFAAGAVYIFLRLRAGKEAGRSLDADDPVGPRNPDRLRKTVGWTLFALGCVVTTALELGASPIVDELARTKLSGAGEKTVVWRDSLPIIARHPFGIGRHAFLRVYPAYKTLSLNTAFEFVENGPLQLLIDFGWGGFAALAAALLWVLRKVPWRRDDVEAALVAGLVAVLAHNLVDFGLETLGMRLPFAALAGVVIGRAYGRRPTEQRLSSTLPTGKLTTTANRAAIFITVASLIIGLSSQLQTSAEEIEQRWKRTETSSERKELAIDGGRRFPTDFFFPLLQSYDEPLRTGIAGTASPKLGALNRAMRLCPTCSVVHEQAARALQKLGHRAQALSSFRDTVRLAPSRLETLLADLDAAGYGASQLASLAVGEGAEIMTVARYLVPKKAEAEVTELLALAGQHGITPVDRLLVQADLALVLGRVDAARGFLGEVRRLAPRDGRCFAALARLEEKHGSLDEALEQARQAVTMAPLSVDFSRLRVGLVVRLHRWNELEDALERLRMALRQNGQNVAEVHVLAGDTHEVRGNLGRALSEFRTAATLDANNPAVWMAIGRVSEQRGDLSGAAEAYQRGAVLRPGDDDLRQAIARVEKERADLRLRQMLP